jgi:hypothetical protein
MTDDYTIVFEEIHNGYAEIVVFVRGKKFLVIQQRDSLSLRP